MRVSKIILALVVFSILLAPVYSAIPLRTDRDGDRLSDAYESQYSCLDPNVKDQDNNLQADGLDDFDGDRVNNVQEEYANTSPCISDTDGDGMDDYYELNTGLNPTSADQDNDGLPDGWEDSHGLNPTLNDADSDLDRDGLSNRQEYAYGTDPQTVDSDGDRLTDKEEVALGYKCWDPIVPNIDTDNDGISDFIELSVRDGYVTDACNKDTDGDGCSDSEESIVNMIKTDPTDPKDCSVPQPPLTEGEEERRGDGGIDGEGEEMTPTRRPIPNHRDTLAEDDVDFDKIEKKENVGLLLGALTVVIALIIILVLVLRLKKGKVS